jgi:ferredoxin
MPQVTFVGSDGQVIKKVDAESGKTILQIALDHNVPMEHACGGNGFCTTCMCSVQEGMPNLSPRNDREENMGVVDDPNRLSCQSEVNGDVTVQLIDI